jgi:hypothetical protein
MLPDRSVFTPVSTLYLKTLYFEAVSVITLPKNGPENVDFGVIARSCAPA